MKNNYDFSARSENNKYYIMNNNFFDSFCLLKKS